MRAVTSHLARLLARRLCSDGGTTTDAAATATNTAMRAASSSSSPIKINLASARPAALVYATHGPPETALDLVPQHPHTLPPPPGTTRVRWLLAPVNWSDVNVVEGTYPGARRPPATPGNEGVGVVEAVGAAVPDDGDAHNPPLAPGDFVVPLSPGAGTWRSVGEVETAALWRVRVVDGGATTAGASPPGGGGLTLDQAATLCIKYVCVCLCVT